MLTVWLTFIFQSGESQAGVGESIADMVKATAEEALSCSGVVFHEQSGMYYDYNTGYYHDPVSLVFNED